jgi:hypothetical protein
MKVIERKTHGYLDYLTGILLMASPWLLDFARGGAESWVVIIEGVAVIIYSLFTDYEMGAFRRLPFRTHILLDIASGIFLVASPWLFNFYEYVNAPHLVIGFLEIGVALLTKTPATDNIKGKPQQSFYNY